MVLVKELYDMYIQSILEEEAVKLCIANDIEKLPNFITSISRRPP